MEIGITRLSALERRDFAVPPVQTPTAIEYAGKGPRAEIEETLGEFERRGALIAVESEYVIRSERTGYAAESYSRGQRLS